MEPDEFVAMAKKDGHLIERKIISFISTQNARVQRTTIDEVQKIFEAADLRGKAVTLVLASSGLREGAIQHLRLEDYRPIKQDNKIVGGRLLVYRKTPKNM
jgi:hypothetical protein